MAVVNVTKFINSSDYHIFPSSNSTGSGKVTTEENIQNIIGRLQLKSFKSEATDFQLSYDKDEAELSITSGKANINGYWFATTQTEVASLTLTSDGTYNIKLGLVYDNNDLLAPDESGKSVCVKLIAEEEASEPAPEYLLLGTIVKNGNTYTTTTSTSNIHAISPDVIIAPNGSDTLTDYLNSIPNTYVSKIANDVKVKKLDFNDTDAKLSVSIDPDTHSLQTICFDANAQPKLCKIDASLTQIRFQNFSDNHPAIVTATNTLRLCNNNASECIDINLNSTKITSSQFELPYTTYFGPFGVADTQNLKVEIGNDNEAPVISSPNSNLQLSADSGNGTVIVNGNFTVTKDIHANRVYNAVFNGFGEIFRKSTKELIEYGDVVCVGSDGLVHRYDSLKYDITSVIGVCSNTIGFMLGGEDIPEDERCEVELVGQIWIKTHEPSITPGSIVTVDVDGTVRRTSSFANKFGVALTNVIDGKVRVLYNGH